MVTVLLWLLLTKPVAAQTGPAGSPKAGKALFGGVEVLANGGPACASCHSVAGLGFSRRRQYRAGPHGSLLTNWVRTGWIRPSTRSTFRR